jgi:copper chaperone CopZ
MTTTRRYRTNLNCGGCVAAVTPHLEALAQVRRWTVDTQQPDKVLTVEGDAPADTITAAVEQAGFRVLGELENLALPPTAPTTTAATYFPLVLIVGYLLGVTALVELRVGTFDAMRAMSVFMGGFFLLFSFFKLLDLRGFAAAYQSYDVVAQRVPAYAFAYPFIELALGVAYVLHLWPMLVNGVTLVLMLVGSIGVLQSLLSRRKIKCACLGTVFNLPMTSVTLIEDLLMAAMAAAMLLF